MTEDKFTKEFMGQQLSSIMGDFLPYAGKSISFHIFLGIKAGTLDVDEPEDYEKASKEVWDQMVPTVRWVANHFSSADEEAFVEMVRRDANAMASKYLELIATEVGLAVEDLENVVARMRGDWN